MPKKMIPVFAALFLALPFISFALGQSFSQNGLTADIQLTPDDLVVGEKVNLALKLEKDGQPVTDRHVTMEVYGEEATEPTIRREIDLLDGEYIDAWSFEKPGDYKVVVSIADPRKPQEAFHYMIKAAVGEAKDAAALDSHEEHGFFSHHFGKKGWWMGGLMLLVMVPLMIVGL